MYGYAVWHFTTYRSECRLEQCCFSFLFYSTQNCTVSIVLILNKFVELVLTNILNIKFVKVDRPS